MRSYVVDLYRRHMEFYTPADGNFRCINAHGQCRYTSPQSGLSCAVGLHFVDYLSPHTLEILDEVGSINAIRRGHITKHLPEALTKRYGRTQALYAVKLAMVALGLDDPEGHPAHDARFDFLREMQEYHDSTWDTDKHDCPDPFNRYMRQAASKVFSLMEDDLEHWDKVVLDVESPYTL